MTTEDSKGNLILFVGIGFSAVALFYIIKLMNGIGKGVGAVVDKVGGVSNEFGITTSDLAKSFKDLPCLKPNFWVGATGSTAPPTTTFANIYQLTEDIYNAKTGSFYTNDDAILSAFKKLHSKNEVSYLSRMFSVRYPGHDLSTYFYSPMQNTYLEKITTFINELPKS